MIPSPHSSSVSAEHIGSSLLKLLKAPSAANVLEPTNAEFQPHPSKHRLKIIEFISNLLSVGHEASEKELIQQGAIRRIFDMFYKHPFNDIVYHHVKSIVVSCFQKNNTVLTEQLLSGPDPGPGPGPDLVNQILAAERCYLLGNKLGKPTTPTTESSQPRVRNTGLLPVVPNKLVTLENSDNNVQKHLQGDAEWVDWHANVVLKSNVVEKVCQWACGSASQDQNKDSKDFFKGTHPYVAEAANNSSLASPYRVYNSDEAEHFNNESPGLPNGELALDLKNLTDDGIDNGSSEPSVSTDVAVDGGDPDVAGSQQSAKESSTPLS